MISQLNILLFIFVSTPFVGRLGNTAQLSAIGLAGSFANVAGMSLMWGLSTGAETLGSQAWGAGNKKRLGLICQRAFLIGLMAVLPCWTVYLNVAPILGLLKQDAEVIHYVNLYIYGFLPALPLTALYIAVMKFLQTQQVVLPVVFAGLLANGFNLLFHYVFINVLDLGLLGAAFSTDLTILIFALSMLLYIRVKNLHRECWGGWTKECLNGWGEYLRLAVPGMFMICLEWWAFEIGMITTGLLGKEYLAANTLCLNFGAYAYLILSGVQIASIILVGNYLGEGSGAKAMTIARVSLFWGFLFFGTLFFVVFFVLNEQLPYILTDDETVIQLTAESLKVVAVMQAVDSIVNVTSGILKGAGKQTFGAVTNFFGYYFIGLPVGVSLMMSWGADMKVPGYWWGQVIGLSVQSFVYISYLTCKINWDKTAAQAAKLASVPSADPIPTADGKADDDEGGGGDEPKIASRPNHLVKLIVIVVFLATFIASFIHSTLHHRIGLRFNSTELSHSVTTNPPLNSTDPENANSTLFL